MTKYPELDTSTPVPEIIWKPLPGSQTMAMDSRANYTLYHGSRGPGKTLTQLMRFIRHVGKGYGKHWRGVIFNCSHKSLDNIVAESKIWIPKLKDGAEWLASASQYMWRWPTGEVLMFRHANKEDDYDEFHGMQLCLPEGELVETENGPIAINNLKVGDEVLTLKGPRKVTNTFNVGKKKVQQVATYTLDGRVHYGSRQSVQHRTLTTEGEWRLLSSHSFQSVPLSVETSYQQEAFQILPDDEYLEIMGSFVQQECEEISSITLHSEHQNDQQLHLYRTFSRRLGILGLCILSMLQRLPIERHNALKSYVLSLERMVSHAMIPYCQEQPSERLLRLLYCLELSSNALQEDGRAVLRTTLDCLVRCLYGRGLYDVLARMDKGNVQSSLPLQLYVQEYSHGNSLDDLVSEVESTLLSAFSYQHPYRKDILGDSNLALSLGFVKVEACGDSVCYDIEVDDTNHYITNNGLTNKNCFIGFDELTKHASPAFHDKVMSTNRSGFDPIADTPKDDYGNYLTPDGLPLPPIPLEVFSTTNSSGVGRNWVKRRFIDPAPSGTMVKTVVDVYNPKTKQREPFTKTQIAIFGSYKENPYLDPQYVAGLETERDPNLRRSWLLGDWNVTSGGALDDLWDDNIHILEPFQIPESWYIDRSYDNGTLHPFSVGFWAEADGTEATIIKSGRVYKWGPPPGTLIQIAEYYGSEEIGTNKGIGLASKTIAQNIKEIEAALKRTGLIKTDVRAGAADNKIRDTNPDADNMEKIMQKEGVYWLPSDKSSGSRAVGLQLFRERLENSKKDEGPGIYFFRTCRASIQTIPCLPRDTKKLDDVDTTAEDHAYDMTRYRILQSKRGSSVSFKVRLPT